MRMGSWTMSLCDFGSSNGVPSRSSPEDSQLTVRSQQHHHHQELGSSSVNDRLRALRETGLGGAQLSPPTPSSADSLQEFPSIDEEAAFSSARSSQSKSVHSSSRVSENNPPPPVTPPRTSAGLNHDAFSGAVHAVQRAAHFY